MARPQLNDPDPDANTPFDSPTAWFAVLERARLTNDYALAARAMSELERLGVRVKFVRRAKEPTCGGGE